MKESPPSPPLPRPRSRPADDHRRRRGQAPQADRAHRVRPGGRRRAGTDRGRRDSLVAGPRGDRGVRRAVPQPGRRRGGLGPTRDPRAGRRPRFRRHPRRGDRHLHDRRQPAEAVRRDRRDTVRRRDPGRARPRRRHRRDQRGGQHPVQSHGCLRRRRNDTQAADDTGGRRPWLAGLRSDRPALRATQPLRASAHDRLAVAPAAGDGRRRGHRRRGDLRCRTPDARRDRSRRRDPLRPRERGDRRPRSPPVTAPAHQRRGAPRAARRLPVRPDHPRARSQATVRRRSFPQASTSRRPRRSPRRGATWASSPGTSRRPTHHRRSFVADGLAPASRPLLDGMENYT